MLIFQLQKIVVLKKTNSFKLKRKIQISTRAETFDVGVNFMDLLTVLDHKLSYLEQNVTTVEKWLKENNSLSLLKCLRLWKSKLCIPATQSNDIRI